MKIKLLKYIEIKLKYGLMVRKYFAEDIFHKVYVSHISSKKSSKR